MNRTDSFKFYYEENNCIRNCMKNGSKMRDRLYEIFKCHLYGDRSETLNNKLSKNDYKIEVTQTGDTYH